MSRIACTACAAGFNGEVYALPRDEGYEHTHCPPPRTRYGSMAPCLHCEAMTTRLDRLCLTCNAYHQAAQKPSKPSHGLPPGRWVTVRHGIKRYVPDDPEEAA